MKRRHFLKLASTSLAATTLPSCSSLRAAQRGNIAGLAPIGIHKTAQSPWLGEEFWTNTPQDWQVRHGRIECLQGHSGFEVRTAHILTRALSAKQGPGRIRATLHNLDPDKAGFGGFLVGAGGGEIDYRSAALIQRAAGHNGGLLAVIEHDGRLSLRDFTDAANPVTFDRYAIDEEEQSRRLAEFAKGEIPITLDCHIDPIGADKCDLRLIAFDAETNEELAFIVKTGLPASIFRGNVALVSSPLGKEQGARFSFEELAIGGDKIVHHPDRTLGPVMGCLHSLNRSVMKMTAQFMPIDRSLMGRARLDYRTEGEARWTEGPEVIIGNDYAAVFRVEDWNPNATFEYRIVDPKKSRTSLFGGLIKHDPETTRPIKIALHSCLLPTSRGLDNLDYAPTNTIEREFDRYSKKNLLFPHSDLVRNCDSHEPDLYVFLGDQYYDGYPTRNGRDTKDAELDTLYRWYLWFWTFRDVLRNTPCIILADDHDILQGNIWGNGGDGTGGPREEDGGYKWDNSLVRMVYRIQCSHNPDNFDPTPILHDIPVSYGSFVYGGTSFAFVEDRKFKIPPDTKTPPKKTRGSLLGERQEAFLKAWANMDKGLPKICLAASIWGVPQTDTNLKPLLDYDANGYPPDGRMRAVKLLRAANAICLVGDQHLAMIARQGIDDYEDGPMFFAGPAGAAFWQRWFEGLGKLDNKRAGDENTGNFDDCFGNKMRVLAVANPKISHTEFKEAKQTWTNNVGDNAFKSEGYGIVTVDHNTQEFEFACWSWDADPSVDVQFHGWPYILPFNEAGRAKP